MHFGPILRALLHNKTRFWLITLEVALTLAIVVNCINVMLDFRDQYTHPSGMDEANLMVVTTEPFAAEFKDEEFVENLEREDLASLRSFPGVRDAMATTSVPLSGGGSATGRKALGSELDTESTPYYVVSDHVVETFGLDLLAGRRFEPGDFELEEDENGDILHRNVLATETLAMAYFPEGDGLGKVIQNEEGELTNTIVGIVSDMDNSWPTWSDGKHSRASGPYPSGRATRAPPWPTARFTSPTSSTADATRRNACSAWTPTRENSSGNIPIRPTTASAIRPARVRLPSSIPDGSTPSAPWATCTASRKGRGRFSGKRTSPPISEPGFRPGEWPHRRSSTATS